MEGAGQNTLLGKCIHIYIITLNSEGEMVSSEDDTSSGEENKEDEEEEEEAEMHV